MKAIVWLGVIVGVIFSVALISTYPVYGSILVGLVAATIIGIVIFDYRRGIKSWNSSVRFNAINSIGDQEFLLHIALHDRESIVRWKAATKITSQEKLVQVILAHPTSFHEDDLKRITDHELLRSIASASNVHWRLRVPAATRLPLNEVARVCCLASGTLEYNGSFKISSINGVSKYICNDFSSAGGSRDSDFITLLPGEWQLEVSYSRILQSKTTTETTTRTSSANSRLLLKAQPGKDYGIVGDIGYFDGDSFVKDGYSARRKDGSLFLNHDRVFNATITELKRN
jgi:hypothetical protein